MLRVFALRFGDSDRTRLIPGQETQGSELGSKRFASLSALVLDFCRNPSVWGMVLFCVRMREQVLTVTLKGW